MKIREYAKAVAALLGSVATFLVTVNAPAEWSLWIGSVVAILTGVATFGVPNKPGGPAPVPVSPAEQVIANLPTVVEQASAAVAELDRVKQAAADALGTTVQQVIDAVRPRP